VLELASDLRFLDKSADHFWVVTVFFQEDLYGHIPSQVDIAALEHKSHSPPSDLAMEMVASGVARGRRNRF
jgi:hypothetical protein